MRNPTSPAFHRAQAASLRFMADKLAKRVPAAFAAPLRDHAAEFERLAEIADQLAEANRLRTRADELEQSGGAFVRNIAEGLRDGAGRIERGEGL